MRNYLVGSDLGGVAKDVPTPLRHESISPIGNSASEITARLLERGWQYSQCGPPCVGIIHIATCGCHVPLPVTAHTMEP